MTATEATVSKDLQDARARIEQCRHAPAEEGKKAFASALVAVVEARNQKLTRSAGAPDMGDAGLRQLNALLSLMASIEFPISGFHRGRIDEMLQALDAAASALESTDHNQRAPTQLAT